MNKFPLVFKHYFKRTLMDKMGLITQIGIPVGIMLFMIITNDFSELIDTQGLEFVEALQTTILSGIVFSFLFFGGAWFMEFLYKDLREAKKWRLGAAPVDKSVYAFGAMAGSFIVSLAQSILVIIVGLILTEARIQNIGIWIVLMLLTAIASHLFHYAITFFAKDKSVAVMLGNIFGIGFALLGGAWIVGIHEAINHPIADFLYDFGTPVSLARRAIDYAPTDMSTATGAILILVGATVLLVIVTFILGKVKKL